MFAFNARPDRKAVIDAAMLEESPGTPVLPDDSKREAGFRVEKLPATPEDVEFTKFDRLAAKLRVTDGLFGSSCKDTNEDVPMVKMPRLLQWLKKEGLTSQKDMTRLQQLGFIAPVGRSGMTVPHPRFLSALNVRCLASAHPQGLADPLTLVIEMHSTVALIYASTAVASKRSRFPEAHVVQGSHLWVRLQKLALQLQDVNVTSLLAKKEQIVFYVNLYHVLLFHALVEIGFPRTHRDRCTFFQVGYLVGGRMVSLDSIDYMRLLHGLPTPPPRDGTPWAQSVGDARVHFALQEYFEASPPFLVLRLDLLERALDEATVFCLTRFVHLEKEHLTLPRTFQWHESAFGKSPAELLSWIQRFLPALRAVTACAYEEAVDTSALTMSSGAELPSSLSPRSTVVLASNDRKSSEGSSVSGNTVLARASQNFRTNDMLPMALQRKTARFSMNSLPIPNDAEFALGGAAAKAETAGISGRGPAPASVDGSAATVITASLNPAMLHEVRCEANPSVWQFKVALWSMLRATHECKLLPSGTAPLPCQMEIPSTTGKLHNNDRLWDPQYNLLRSGAVRVTTEDTANQASKSVFLGKHQPSAPHTFAGGRGLSHAVLGVTGCFEVYLVDSNGGLIQPSSSMVKLLEVEIHQGRRPVSVSIEAKGDHVEVSFRPDSLEVFLVAVTLQQRSILGSPFREGQVLDLTNPQQTVVAKCRDPTWGYELAEACRDMKDPFKQVGDAVLRDLVFSNCTSPAVMRELLPLFVKRVFLEPAKFFDAAKLFDVSGCDGLSTLTSLLLSSNRYFSDRDYLAAERGVIILTQVLTAPIPECGTFTERTSRWLRVASWPCSMRCPCLSGRSMRQSSCSSLSSRGCAPRWLQL